MPQQWVVLCAKYLICCRDGQQISIQFKTKALDGSQVYTPVYSKKEKLYVGYHCDKSILLRYTDSDFQSNNDSYKSNFGFVFTLDGGAISWRSVV